MLTKLFFILTLVIFGFNVFSQQDTVCFYVCDYNRQPISFANIKFSDTTGTVSFYNGKVILIIDSLSENQSDTNKSSCVGTLSFYNGIDKMVSNSLRESHFDTIKVSCLGYKSKSILFSSLGKNDTVYLKEEMIQLDEVVVNGNIKYKVIKLGNRRRNGKYHWENIPGFVGWESAIRFTNFDKKTKVKSINIHIKKVEGIVDLEIFILSADKKSGMPGKKLIKKPIVVKLRDKGWLTIDIMDLDIEIKKSKDFFIIIKPILGKDSYVDFSVLSSKNTKWKDRVFDRLLYSDNMDWVTPSWAWDNFLPYTIYFEMIYKK